MIANRWRTLLLNQAGNLPDSAGEEYVSPDFIEKPMRGPALAVWQTLFGSDPDRAYRNYLLYQYETVLHTSPLADEVFAFDPRVTYWPIQANSQRWRNQFGTLGINLLSGSGTIIPASTPPADDRGGRSNLQLNIDVSGSTLTFPGGSVSLTFSNNTAIANLPHWSGLSLYVRQGSSGQWRISGNLRPKRSAATAHAALDQIEAEMSSMFGLSDRTKALRDYYQAAKSAPDRLAPVLLLLGHQLIADRGEPTVG